MSTNTADMTNYHPHTPVRKLEDYTDIIHCKRPRAPNPMDIEARATQFAPYAALVGHKDIVENDEVIASSKNDVDHDIIIEYDKTNEENYDN